MSPRPPLTILLGPPRTGKTTRVLDRYRRLAADGVEPRRLLFLVPTALAIEAVTERLMRVPEAPRCLAGARIMTFERLAYEILRQNDPKATHVSALGKRLLLEQVVANRRRAAGGRLAYYERIAGTGGFIDTLADLFGEFKRQEITPERFEAQLVAGDGGSAKDRDTLALYAEYQRRLKAADAYDTEGELWRVRDLLKEGRREPFDGLAALFLDGFHSFTATQLEVLPLLAAGAEEALCALPSDAEPQRRHDLFDTVRRTIRQLRTGFTVTVETTRRAAGPKPRGLALEALADGLFDDAAAPVAAARGPAVRLLEAPGATGEVAAIARHIKRLVVDEGRYPDDIAVVVRSIEPYSAAFDSAFSAFGIPFRTASNPGADAVPVVRFILDCLETLAAGWPWRRTAALAKSSYLPPGTVDGDDVDLALRAAGVAEGYEAHLAGLRRALAHLDDEIARGKPGDSMGRLDFLPVGAPGMLSPDFQDDEFTAPSDPRRRRAAVAAALEALPRLAGLLGEWPGRAGWAFLLAATRALVRNLDLVQRAGRPVDGDLPGVSRRRDDLLGLAAFGRVLDELAAVHETDDDAITLAEYVEHLRRALSAVGIDRPGPRDGAVALLDAYEARALRFPIVFVAGLLEGLFPRTHRDHPFYGELDRQRLRDRDLWLARRDEDQREEMFLFLMAVTRADERLYLTHPYVDESGRQTVVSSYLEEVRRLLPEAPAERTRPVEAAPRWDRVACEADLRLRTAEDLCRREWVSGVGGQVSGAEGEQSGSLAPGTRHPTLNSDARAGLRWLAGQRPDALRTLLEGAAVERERESLKPPGPWDGTLTDAVLLESLSGAYPPERAVSPTTLDRYRACPFAFFLERLLGAEALPEPQEDFPPAERGLLLHRVLAQFYRRREFRPVTEADRAEACECLAALAEAQFRHVERLGLAPAAGLWRMHQDDIRHTLERFVEAELAETTWRPGHVEVAFGYNPVLRLDAGEQSLRIHGRIDRVDGRADGSAGLRVIDYKSGANPPKPTKRLQLPLYLAAAFRLFPQREGAGEADYYRLRGQVGPTAGPRTRIDWEAAIGEAVAAALEALDAIRSGRFAPVPENDEDACRWCDWQRVCRRDGQRLEAKIKREDERL